MSTSPTGWFGSLQPSALEDHCAASVPSKRESSIRGTGKQSGLASFSSGVTDGVERRRPQPRLPCRFSVSNRMACKTVVKVSHVSKSNVFVVPATRIHRSDTQQRLIERGEEDIP
jgi:hypothetical protein